MTECVICKKNKNNQPFDYTFVSMSVLCKKCKDRYKKKDDQTNLVLPFCWV